jgi:hypothetical protein
MSRMALHSVRWLRNHGLTVGYRTAGGSAIKYRFVRPGESVTVLEAAKALGTYDMLLYRLAAKGGLKLMDNGGAARVPWRELSRLRRLWRRGGPTTVKTES